jgi:hypothetical protein
VIRNDQQTYNGLPKGTDEKTAGSSNPIRSFLQSVVVCYAATQIQTIRQPGHPYARSLTAEIGTGSDATIEPIFQADKRYDPGLATD